MSKLQLQIPRDALVFLLEDSHERVEWFKGRFDNLTWVSTVWSAVQAVRNRVFQQYFLDHDLLAQPGPRGDGTQFAEYLASTGENGKKVLIHSWNPKGAQQMKAYLPQATVIPFGEFEIA